jgi:hypothetical protein
MFSEYGKKGEHILKLPLTIFIVAPCILVYVEFTHQQMHFFYLKNTLKFTLKYT